MSWIDLWRYPDQLYPGIGSKDHVIFVEAFPPVPGKSDLKPVTLGVCFQIRQVRAVQRLVV
ncbi:hypothetical protein, partial [Pseudomonas sp. SHC52]|uniref:hypothetical protein n=1 Tax=Pseudomonas sp. SHC52 TaxID=984195 RepID=UPI0012EDD7CE